MVAAKEAATAAAATVAAATAVDCGHIGHAHPAWSAGTRGDKIVTMWYAILQGFAGVCMCVCV